MNSIQQPHKFFQSSSPLYVKVTKNRTASVEPKQMIDARLRLKEMFENRIKEEGNN